jgi:3-hydroxyisobutyrate dehydrogenase-like beta-hydroxyacid dehydrogenase
LRPCRSTEGERIRDELNCLLGLLAQAGAANMTGALRVGFIGLGHMGHGMAANILKHGFPLWVMGHRSREAVDDLVRRGAQEVLTPKDMAASCDIILLCVPGAKEVETLVANNEGLAAGAAAGLTVVDCTTSDPSTLLRLADEFGPRGLVFVDAPLGRSPHEAWKGALSTMVGGDVSTLERIRPVLAAFATTIQHVGALGDGHRLKLVNNFISLGYAVLYSEALALAIKAGLTTTSFDDLVRSSRMHCPFYDTFIAWATSGNSQSHPYALDDALRTISDVAQFLRSVGLNGRLASGVRDVYARAVADGFGASMLPELPRAVAKANNIDLTPASECAVS